MKVALQRLQEAAERPSDRSTLVDMLCFTVIHCRLCSAEHLPDRKLLRMCTDLHTQVRRVYVPKLCLQSPQQLTAAWHDSWLMELLK